MSSDLEPPPSNRLVETLRDAQRLGFFGDAPIEQATQHARAYLAPLRPLSQGSVVYDLGSGGGLPGLVIAEARPDLALVLIDRRQKRTDFLKRSRLRLRLDNVEVRCADVATIVAEVETGKSPCGMAVTARGFGPPSLFLDTSSRLLCSGGRSVISEPPTGDRWDAAELEAWDLEAIDHDPDPGESARIQVLRRRSRQS